MSKTIRIYNGQGALQMCAQGVDVMLRHVFGEAALANEDVDIRYIDHHEIRSATTRWAKETDLLVISGGGVTAFKEALGEAGVSAIKDFVNKEGGHYLGLCAGAYFGADNIEFTGYDWRSRKKYMRTSPGLGFFNGLALGSIDEIAPAYDGTSATCRAVDVLLDYDDPNKTPSIVPVFYGGGPEFVPSEGAEYQKLSSYILPNSQGVKLAAVSTNVGDNGGSATLISWHPELDPQFLENWMEDRDNEDIGDNRLKLAQSIQARIISEHAKKPQNWLGNILKNKI